MSLKGHRETKEVGRAFRELGIEIDGIFSSAFLRALETAKDFREAYMEGKEGASLSIHLKVKLHEEGGCYKGSKCLPGFTKQQALELIPDLVIADDQPIDD